MGARFGFRFNSKTKGTKLYKYRNTLGLAPEITNRHNCTYSCSVTAECKDYKVFIFFKIIFKSSLFEKKIIDLQLECGCLKGFNDVSAKFEKPPGSICTKCNNSVPQGTGLFMICCPSRRENKPQRFE